MRFCPICGRPLQDGETCACQEVAETSVQAEPVGNVAEPENEMKFAADSSVNDRTEAGAPASDAPDQAQAEQAYQPYGQPQQAAAYQPFAQPQQAQYAPVPPVKPKDDKFTKALNSIPVAFKSYFKNSEKVIEIAKNSKDIILPLMYIAIFFIANLVLSVVFFARMTSYTYWIGLGNLASVFGAVNRFNLGFVILAAVIMTVFDCFVYTLARFVAQLVFAKKAPEEAIIGSVIEFGFHTIPMSVLVLAAALFGIITAWLVVPLVGLAASWLAVQYVTATLKDAEGFENKFIRSVIIAVTLMIGIALVFWMLSLVCAMNYSYRAVSLSGYSEMYSEIGSLLNNMY